MIRWNCAAQAEWITLGAVKFWCFVLANSAEVLGADDDRNVFTFSFLSYPMGEVVKNFFLWCIVQRVDFLFVSLVVVFASVLSLCLCRQSAERFLSCRKLRS